MPIHKKHQAIYTGALKSFRKMTPFERLVTIVGSFEPLTSIPQVTRVYFLQSAQELPLFSWSFGLFGTTLWLIYGIKRKSWPLVIASILWSCIYVPIVIAIVLYG